MPLLMTGLPIRGCVVQDISCVVIVEDMDTTFVKRINKDRYILRCTNLPNLVHSYTSLFVIENFHHEVFTHESIFI